MAASRSTGTFASRCAALRAAQREGQAVLEGGGGIVPSVTSRSRRMSKQLVPQQTPRCHDSRSVPDSAIGLQLPAERQPVQTGRLAV